MIIPELADMKVIKYHDVGGVDGTIVLWYNGMHYDWCRPKQQETFEEWNNGLDNGPDDGVRGGGKKS